jgi:histidinol-phosphate aminotransferase
MNRLASAPGVLPAPRPELGLSEGYHSPQVPVAVRLNTNESPYPPPEKWLEALAEEVRRVDYNRYPDRSAGALREALAELHGARTAQVFAANGSNEVLQCLFLAYGGPGRRAAMWEPTYALHSHIARLTGTEVVAGRRGPTFEVGPEAVEELVERARPSLTLFCSPNNPTGLVEDPSAVSRAVSAGDGLVIVDEAYGQFASWSALGLVRDDLPLAVVRTFSKTWSMAALRLGYLVGPAEVVKALERVALPYHLDALKQAAGRLALRFIPEMERRVAAIVAERERLASELNKLPVETWASQANFLLFRPLEKSGHDVWRELLARSVLVRDTSTWPGLEGTLRVTVGLPAENTRFLSALGEVLS